MSQSKARDLLELNLKIITYDNKNLRSETPREVTLAKVSEQTITALLEAMTTLERISATSGYHPSIDENVMRSREALARIESLIVGGGE